jgi:ABC-type bacteriocin/lantibiotic exporter with double-glycine peptidase domain
MFTSAFIVALIYQWRVALVMFGLAPITCALMSIMSQLLSNNTTKEMAGVGKAGAIAEESVLGVRTVQAFNGQEEMVHRYEKQLDQGKKYALIKGFWAGLLGGIFSAVLFVFIGVGML